MLRRRIIVTGIVQGVGYRPTVHRFATKWAIAGFVLNRSGDVVIEVEGPSDALDGFMRDLTAHPPSASRVETFSFIEIF